MRDYTAIVYQSLTAFHMLVSKRRILPLKFRGFHLQYTQIDSVSHIRKKKGTFCFIVFIAK